MSDERGRRIEIEGTYNLRDTGGLTAGDRVTRHGVLYRSDALHGITPAGRQAFDVLGVGTVIDLRDPQERSMQPTTILGPDVIRIDQHIFPDTNAVFRPGWRILDFYLWVLEQHPDRLAGAVQAVADADPERAVLVHCTAGKDRTGFACALIRHALGVAEETIAADYLLTNRYYRRDPASSSDLPDAVKQVLGAVDVLLLDAAFDTIRSDYGDLESYFHEGLGVGHRERAELLARYLEA